MMSTAFNNMFKRYFCGHIYNTNAIILSRQVVIMRVYFDNAATTYPKPDSVADAVYDYIKNNGSNIGRGSYQSALTAAEKVYETREFI